MGIVPFVVAWSYNLWKVLSWCLIFATPLLIAFSILVDDTRERGDEREVCRRDHEHFVAYRSLAPVLIAALFAAYFRGPNPITSLLPSALRDFFTQLPYVLLMAAGILYITLPRAILLWTEPDMEEPL